MSPSSSDKTHMTFVSWFKKATDRSPKAVLLRLSSKKFNSFKIFGKSISVSARFSSFNARKYGIIQSSKFGFFLPDNRYTSLFAERTNWLDSKIAFVYEAYPKFEILDFSLKKVCPKISSSSSDFIGLLWADFPCGFVLELSSSPVK